MRLLKKLYFSFLTTAGLLSRVTVPLRYTPDFTFFPLFLPLAGVFVTAVLTSLYAGLSFLGIKPSAAAALLLVFQYVLFNLFHFDGLLDSADALLYRTTPERRLAILKDKSAGSFAVFTGSIYLMAKFSFLTGLIRSVSGFSGLLFIFSYSTAGRIAGGMVPLLSSPAKEEGLGALLKNFQKHLFLAGAVLAWAVTILSGSIFSEGSSVPVPAAASAALTAAVLCGALCALIFNRKIGGFTGDAVGMAIELGELSYLLVLFQMTGGAVHG